MKKILVLTNESKAISELMVPQIRELVQRGNIVHCACNFDLVRDSGLLFEEVSIFTIPMSRKLLSPSNFKAFFRLMKLQRENKYDIIYTYKTTARLCSKLLKLQYKSLFIESFEALMLDSAADI